MSDTQSLAQIKTQTLARIAEITAQPKPTYTIDGQNISWAEYLAQLQDTVDWCDRHFAAEQPFEAKSQGYT